ncbi:hypothetical protein IHV84_02850 [Acidovorax sp. IB03]|uniref:hypothetical protein n=1 Tax=Acidovorax sp. IB03 TaxID=2779366 RepID=UPI0018E860CA|nr:hypothetical protein [Acidovorax sp. IB03]MBJ2162912.1 hypothetical protein [Acidovorax sp. IB03]
MTNTPSDAEIEALAAENLKAFAQFTGAGDVWVEGEVAFARAVLAKWGSPQPVAREPLTCEWTHNDDDGYWDTSCGKAWRFDDGGPKENNMNFCHCCGKTLRIKGKEAVNADT